MSLGEVRTAHGFPKSARLRRRAEYLAVKAGGQGFAEGPLAASHVPCPVERETRPAEGAVPAAHARVGITVSSKVGGAVVRSRVKRRIREAVRLELSELPAVDLVVVARASAVDASVEQLRGWLLRAARRMEKAKRDVTPRGQT